jgi:hypothetical protein
LPREFFVVRTGGSFRKCTLMPALLLNSAERSYFNR